MSHALMADSAKIGRLRVPGSPWSVADSGELYRISHWGRPYFSINARGHLAVCTNPGASGPIDLAAIVAEARCRGVEPPLMIRFPEILRAQVARLHRDFKSAVTGTGYGNHHLALYPIKVNPLRHVVSEIVDAGRKYGMGLECGSRSELACALAHLPDERSLLVCNGVKDESMLALAIDAQRLGRQVVPVVQSLEEFAALRSIASSSGIEPALGVRIRLSDGIHGRWGRFVVPDAKFGLSMADLLVLLEQSPDVLPQLRLLHFHLGSQVTDLARLQRAAREAAQVYASLVQRGAGLQYLDVGGGLGVNYGDAGSASASELNYSMAEYAHTIVAAINDVCLGRSVPHPVLVSESGRAVTAHHAVLIVPVLSVRERRGFTRETEIPPQACDATVMLVRSARHRSRPRDAGEASALLAQAHDAYRQLGVSFAEGRVTMEEFAVAERAFVTVARRTVESLGRAGVPLPAQIKSLEHSLADRILCDFSVFQSLPDHWAAGQAFPVMPIDRLNERPSRRGILVDLTCDSDGRINRYISSDPDASVLPMHSPRPGATTDLGFFLMGAYEDVLGNPHNLIGRVSEVHVRAAERAAGRFNFENIVPATTVADMLMQMGYSEGKLRTAMSDLVKSRVEAGDLPPEDGRRMIERYTGCLGQGTYCEAGSRAGPEPRAGPELRAKPKPQANPKPQAGPNP